MLRRAPEVAKIADEIIRKVPRHKNLAEARIEYVFRDEAPRLRGRVVLGRARKIGGLNAFLLDPTVNDKDFVKPGPLFVIEISHDTWGDLNLEQRKALVDHELCHCTVDIDDDGNPELSMRGHDFEEFAEIIERHGLWSTSDKKIGAAVAEQLVLAIESVTDFVEGLGTNAEPDDGAGKGGES